MTLFGIGGRRGIPAPLGKVSQQSVGSAIETSTAATPSSVGGSVVPRLGGGGPVTGGVGGGLITARTIAPKFITPEISSGIKLPPIAKFIPPLILPPKKTYEQDTLNVSQFRFSDTGFQAIEKNGISVFRPEIISVLDFQPVDGTGTLGNKNPTESTEQLIKAQYQATEIRGLTLVKLVQDMRAKRDLRPVLDSMKARFASSMSNTHLALQYYSGIIDKIEEVQTSLDPKKIPNSSFDTTKYLPIKDFYERKMQYSRSKFANFSDTKIVNQLISDLRNVLEGYSFSLLDTVDSDRINDYNPVKIDKSYTQTNGFTFAMASLRSNNQGNVIASTPAFFNQFLNSLPNTADDRIKLLTTVLSKELRVSKQMGKPEVARLLLEKYNQGNTSNPFDNICGLVGDTIFDEPAGPDSLATLAFGKSPAGNATILPFESIYVDSEDERKTFVPGSSYLANNILNVTSTGYNIKPYMDFADRYNSITSAAKSTIETLLELKTPGGLSPEEMFEHFLLSVVEATSGLASSSGIDRSQAICVALFKLANTDTTLKNLLFEYLLLLGLISITDTDQKKTFERLSKELISIQSLTFAKLSSANAPNLLGGFATLRPYIENISRQIEERIFSLIYPVNLSTLNKDILKLIPSIGTNLVSPTISGPTNIIGSIGAVSRLLNTNKTMSSLQAGGYLISFQNGEIKETLINTAAAVGPASTNLCKEFVDLCVKFDQFASISANPVYLVADNTHRTRQNFLSISTQMVVIFEILSSIAQKYTFSTFNKGTFVAHGNITIDTALTSAVNKAIKEVISVAPRTKYDIAKNTRNIVGGGNISDAILSTRPTSGPFSINSKDSSRESMIKPSNSGIPSHKNASTKIVNIPSLYSVGKLKEIASSPMFGFGNKFIDIPGILADTVKVLECKKSIVGIRTKLADEDAFVENILHILDVINKRLNSTREMISRAFTLTSLNTFLTSTGLTVADMELVKTPSQVKTSMWLYDLYDERLSDATTTTDSEELGLGYVITDRIPQIHLNAMFSMFQQSKFGYKNLADSNVKILTVGIPAGFSKNLSDRVERTAINSANFTDKQFDVVAINVYKRDARFDDIVFKPQKFLFDLSLFPIKKFLPASMERADVSYSQLVKNVRLRDYQTLYNKQEVTHTTITTNEKYNFLSYPQKYSLIKNHLESQLLDLYIRLLGGLRMSEETFTEQSISVGNPPNLSELVISYLKKYRAKTIPDQPISQLLLNPEVDQESKDIIRLLSYGNIMFTPDFVKQKILKPKLFDRVFHLPVNLEDFEIDTEATLSTESGRMAYTKSSFQEQIVRNRDAEYLVTKNRNDARFEDIFVVIEANLRNGI